MSEEARKLQRSMDLFFKHALIAEDKGDDEKAEKFLNKAVEKETALLKLGNS